MSSKKEALAQFHRDNIIAAAKELFAAKGIEASSMDEISAKAEYSKSTVYVYYTGKDDIYYNIVKEYMNQLYEGIADIMAQNKGFKTRYFCYLQFACLFLRKISYVL